MVWMVALGLLAMGQGTDGAEKPLVLPLLFVASSEVGEAPKLWTAGSFSQSSRCVADVVELPAVGGQPGRALRLRCEYPAEPTADDQVHLQRLVELPECATGLRVRAASDSPRELWLRLRDRDSELFEARLGTVPASTDAEAPTWADLRVELKADLFQPVHTEPGGAANDVFDYPLSFHSLVVQRGAETEAPTAEVRIASLEVELPPAGELARTSPTVLGLVPPVGEITLNGLVSRAYGVRQQGHADVSLGGPAEGLRIEYDLTGVPENLYRGVVVRFTGIAEAVPSRSTLLVEISGDASGNVFILDFQDANKRFWSMPTAQLAIEFEGVGAVWANTTTGHMRPLGDQNPDPPSPVYPLRLLRILVSDPGSLIQVDQPHSGTDQGTIHLRNIWAVPSPVEEE